MLILIINSGSSSVKYQLRDTGKGDALAKGLVSRISLDNPLFEHIASSGKYEFSPQGKIDHKHAIELILLALVHPKYGVIENIGQIDAVGHRVVHGGEEFSNSALIDARVMDCIRKCITLAPLHNPANLMGIEACKQVLPDTPQAAVFDTAFHQTMPSYAFTYALPYELYEQHHIRRYGFHGTSHYYVAHRAAKMLGKPIEQLKLVTAHLGNGASIAAVCYGKSVDTSMGLTPLEGLVMGTRSGDIDPAIAIFLMERKNLSPKDIDNLLNRKSGLLGISGISSDLRDILSAADSGNARAKLAMEVYAYRIRKYIGAYAAAMGGLDALIFTAGVGENSPPLRAMTVQNLAFLGIALDRAKNEKAVGIEMNISAENAFVKTLVIPTNEEFVIAMETEKLIEAA